MNLIKLKKPFYKIKDKDLIISKPINKEILDKEELKDTVLDSRLETQCGYIKLKPRMLLYNYYTAKQKISSLTMFNNNPYYLTKKCEVYLVEKDDYLRVPQKSNKVFKLESGLKILTRLQKAYNNILLENNTIRNKDENIYYQNAYTRLLVEFNALLSGKGGLFDRAVNSLWPYSVRATIINDPTLKLNEICLPYRTLLGWVSKEEVRKSYNIDLGLSNREAVRFLEGKRVIAIRQPSHDRSNMMSFKIKIKYNNS